MGSVYPKVSFTIYVLVFFITSSDRTVVLGSKKVADSLCRSRLDRRAAAFDVAKRGGVGGGDR